MVSAAGFFLQRDNEIRADEHAELLGRGAQLQVRHPRHDEQTIVENVHLGPLVRVDDVFQRQPMQAENLAELFDRGRVPQAVDVQPQHRLLADPFAHVGRPLNFVFDHGLAAVRDDLHRGGVRIRIDRNRPRRPRRRSPMNPQPIFPVPFMFRHEFPLG